MAEYISTNSGLLAVSNVKEGDKLILLEDAYPIFSEKNQKTYWNCKVRLPDGSEKLAGLMEISCERFVEKWGRMTENWTGHTVLVSIKTSKGGKEYIILSPTDDPIVKTGIDITEPSTEYPTEEISPEDIPF